MKNLALLFFMLVSIHAGASSPIPVYKDKSTFLYCTKASLINGELEATKGRNMKWRGNQELGWEIEVPDDELYELYIVATVPETGRDKNLYLQTNDEEYSFKLSQTFGPYPFNRAFIRTKLSSSVPLKKGTQKILISTRGESTNELVLEFVAIELLPISAKETIEIEYQRAVASRASVDWFRESGYGLMFHWTSESVQRDGSKKSFEEAVNAFDVDQFAAMVEETGAGHVMFTIGHAESYCPAPIKSWERVHPGQTTSRDLIKEIAKALKKKGVRFMCYINAPRGFKYLLEDEDFDDAARESFVENYQDILSEMGRRYKKGISGYWFDSWYQIFQEFPGMPFEDFFNSTKTGNKNRIICLNSWIYPSVSPWQDYWAGETGKIITPPVNGYISEGPVTDLPHQALLKMEPWWVQEVAEMPEPAFNSQELIEYISACMENKGVITINLGIYQDGTIGEKNLEYLKEVKKEIRK